MTYFCEARAREHARAASTRLQASKYRAWLTTRRGYERREEERSRAKIQRAECRPLRASPRGTRARNLDASPHFLRSPSCRFPLAIPLVFFSFRILPFISRAAHWPTIFDGNFLTVEYFSSAISMSLFIIDSFVKEFFLYLDENFSILSTFLCFRIIFSFPYHRILDDTHVLFKFISVEEI